MGTTNVSLEKAIKQMCEQRGMDVVGFADPALVEAPSYLKPSDALPECRSIIVFGKAVPSEAYAEDSNKAYNKAVFSYHDVLDALSADIVAFLQSRGHPSVLVGAFRPIVFRKGKFRGRISLKHAAQAAGIGTIGLNTLLLSPKYGPRLRMGGVVTTARLTPDSPMAKPVCIEGCTLCIDKCPYGALSKDGIDFYRCLTRAHGHPLISTSKATEGFPDWNWLNKVAAWMYNTFGANYTYLCWECITSCPLFPAGQ